MKPPVVRLTLKQFFMFADRSRHVELFTPLAAKYGKVFQIRFGPFSAVVITDIQLIAEAERSMDRGDFMRKGAGALGASSVLLMPVDKIHEAMRMVMGPAFQAKSYLPLVTATTHTRWVAWTSQRSINVVSETSALARDLALATLFHQTPLTSNEQEVFVKVVEVMAQTAPIRAYLPSEITPVLPGGKWEKQARAIIRGIIANRLKNESVNGDGAVGYDLVGLLLQSQLSKQEVEDNVLTAFIAAFETTAGGMGSLLQLQQTEQKVMQKVREEVAAILGDEPITRYDQLNQLTYTGLVVNEMLRREGPSWSSYAGAKDPATLGDYQLPASPIMILMTWMGHNDETWGDPEMFRPERMNNAHPLFIPFGIGMRTCLGAKIAEMELAIFLVSAVRHTVQIGITYPRYFGGTLRPDPRTFATIQPRR